MSEKSKKSLWTNDQLNVIGHERGDLLVSASAGCGKTSVMNARIAKLILGGEQLSEMIVTTFTKASAADMKSKLSDLLFDILKGSAGTDKFIFATRALKQIPRAQISTLHSFCGQLIKDYFYTVGIDPEFEIMDENDSNSMLYGLADEVIEGMSEENGDEYFVRLCEVMMRDRSLKPLSNELVRLYKFATVRPDFDEFLQGCFRASERHEEYMTALIASMDSEFTLLEAEAQSLLERTKEAQFNRNIAVCENLYDSIKKRVQATERASGRIPQIDIYIALNEELGALKKHYTKLLERLQGYKDSVDPIKTLPFVDILARGVTRLKERYDSEKSRKALADYSDLEHYTLKILSDTNVIEDLKARFKYMFIDEYQDINPIQEEIISRIPVDKFFVGDIKQSIYAFRMCDPKIFVERDKRFLNNDGGKSLSLNANFRSTWNILDFANRVFSAIMTTEFGAVDYKGRAAFEKRDCVDADVCIDVVTAPVSQDDERVEFYSVERHAREATDKETQTLMSAEINLIINRIYDIMEQDPNADKGRIAILLRTVSSKFCSCLKERLKKEGIAFTAPDKKPANECRAVATLIEYLKLIDNRYNDIALIAVMRSSLGGFTDEEICQIRAKSDTKFFHEAVKSYISSTEGNDLETDKLNQNNQDTALKAKLTVFFEELDRYTNISYTLSASQTAGIICAEKEYFNYIFATAGGKSEAGELSAFLDTMDSSMYNSSVSDYVRALQKNMPTIEVKAGDDSIKIMSIHASKGLEFDHVILPDMAKGFNDSDFKRNIILDPVYGLALKFWDNDDRQEKATSLFNIASVQGRRRNKEEEMRILYVAITRAKRSLYLTARKDKDMKIPQSVSKAESYLDWLLYSGVPINSISINDCVIPKREAQRAMYRAPNKELAHAIREYINDEHIVPSEPVKVSVTSYLKAVKADSPDMTDTVTLGIKEYYADTDRAMEKGTAYHRFMELFDYTKDFESEYKRAYTLTDNANLTDKQLLKTAFDKVGAYINGRRIHREMPFIADMQLDDGTGVEQKSVLVQGIIDLLIETNEGYEIIDYKTGYINNQRLSSYAHQLSIYRDATEKILKKRVAKTSIYAVDEGRLIVTF